MRVAHNPARRLRSKQQLPQKGYPHFQRTFVEWLHSWPAALVRTGLTQHVSILCQEQLYNTPQVGWLGSCSVRVDLTQSDTGPAPARRNSDRFSDTCAGTLSPQRCIALSRSPVATPSAPSKFAARRTRASTKCELPGSFVQFSEAGQPFSASVMNIEPGRSRPSSEAGGVRDVKHGRST